MNRSQPTPLTPAPTYLTVTDPPTEADREQVLQWAAELGLDLLDE